MTQQDAQDFLKAHKNEWFTAREISAELGISLASATKNCMGLRRSTNVVYRFRNSSPTFPKEYKYKDMSKVR